MFSSVFLFFFFNLQGKENHVSLCRAPKLGFHLHLSLKRNVSSVDLRHQLNLVPLSIPKGQRKIFQLTLSLSHSPLLPNPLANSGGADGFGVMPQGLTDVNSNGITRGQIFSMGTFKPNTLSAPNKQLVLHVADFKYSETGSKSFQNEGRSRKSQ